MQFSDDDDRKVPDADGILAFCGKPEVGCEYVEGPPLAQHCCCAQIQASRDPAELYTIAITLSIVIGVIGAVAVHAPRLMFFPVTKQFWMFVSLVRSQRVRPHLRALTGFPIRRCTVFR